VVLPDDSGPKISVTRPLGSPPTPKTASTANEPVEITLTGINLGTWGMDFHSKETFSSLVEDIANLNGNFRVRLSSINPIEIDDHLIELISQHEKICPHLHIPLQSGDTEVLSKMRRNYNAKQYEHIVRRAADKISPLGLGADIIVGFPGESEDNFQETYDFLNNLEVSYLHVFSYSQRDNTDAVNIQPKVPQNIIAERSQILHHLSIHKKRFFYENNIGKIKQVLIENWEDGIISGHSENYIPIALKGNEDEVNQIIPVKLIRLEDGEMAGERLD